MLYMVEFGFDDASRMDEFNRWYLSYLEMLLGIDGFLAAQRFLPVDSGPLPPLAIYSIASPDVLTSEQYKAKAGPQGKQLDQWRYGIKAWHRNLMEGIDDFPEVATDQMIVTADAAEPVEAAVGDLKLTWLKSVWSSGSTAFRGIAVIDRSHASAWRGSMAPSPRIYRPLTPRVRS